MSDGSSDPHEAKQLVAGDTQPDAEHDQLLDHEYDGIREYDNPMPRWWLWILYATVVCASQQELYRYLTTRVAGLPAITHIETAPVIRTVKQAANQTL